MSTYGVYLVMFRPAERQRAHFSVYLTTGPIPGKGMLIHVVGAPMVGFSLEIRKQYDLQKTTQLYQIERLGDVTSDQALRFEQLASHVVPPPISENFMAPVDGVKNKRCQEWTTEYIQYLVKSGVIDSTALDIVQSKRDPPSHGVGLNPVA